MLTIEPEPWCSWEYASELAQFMASSFAQHGRPLIEAIFGGESDDIISDHLGLCLDTCHLSVNYESVTAALAEFASVGLRPAKVQVSACPEWLPGMDPQRLLHLAEPRFQHQCTAD